MFKVGDRVEITAGSCQDRQGIIYTTRRFKKSSYPYGVILDEVLTYNPFTCEGEKWVPESTGNRSWFGADYEFKLIEKAPVFNVGDPIEVVNSTSEFYATGDKGKVVAVNSHDYSVQFHKPCKCVGAWYIHKDCMKLIKEAQMFKEKDRIVIVNGGSENNGIEGTIITTNRSHSGEYPFGVALDSRTNSPYGAGEAWAEGVKYPWFCKADEIKLLKEETMRDRIEAVTGWDKDADDILQEIYADLREQHYIIAIGIRNTESYGYHQEVEILLGLDRKPIISFSYKNQCQKLRAFKDVLLWLAAKAGLLDKEQTDIAAIKVEIAGLKTHLSKLEASL